MSGADTGLIRFRRETAARVDALSDLLIGTPDGRPGLAESVRSLQAEQSHLRSDVSQLASKVDDFSSKLDALLVRAKQPTPAPTTATKRRALSEVFFTKSRLRSALFVLGAIGACWNAIGDVEHLTVTGAIGVVSAALFGFALRWPSDSTKLEVLEREEKLKRAFPSEPPQ